DGTLGSVMSSALFRRARRAEAGAKRAEDRRRLRLEFFRAALAEGFDSLKGMHAGGASGQEAVQAHARFVDEILHALTTPVAGDRRLHTRFRRVLRDNVYRHDFEQFLATTLAERDQRYRKHGASPYIGEPNVKESAGGLRDVHTAMWLGSAKFGARTLRELT